MKRNHLEMAARAGINFPTIRPLFRNPPNRAALDAWASSHAPSLRPTAQKIVAHVNYISFENFLYQLTRTVRDFNARVTGPYILWLGQLPCYIKAGCSDAWVAGLALEHCGLRWPEKILSTNQLISYLHENTRPQTLLMLDDAAYSGSHLADQLKHVIYHGATHTALGDALITPTRNCALYLGIPFMTSRAEELANTGGFLSVNLLEHQSFPLLREILSREELDTLSALPVTHQTASYFDHRFPDAFSTLPHLEHGWRLGELRSTTAPMIPTVIPPYRLHAHQDSKLPDLLHAIRNRRVGPRTDYPIPERYKELKDLLTAEKVAFSIAQKPNSLTSFAWLLIENYKVVSLLLALLLIAGGLYLKINYEPEKPRGFAPG